MTGYRLSRASIIEHLALACDLDLQGFCERFQKTLALPKFEFGHENMTEWGLVEFRWGFALRIRRHFGQVWRDNGGSFANPPRR